MAIFVALIFQVLFVFFAMLINMGLLVHDKINLQNSVDIAAIYGAQRQSEILNAIAHSNYQIHQSWKLLAWRLRVIGDAGRNGHPATNPLNTGPFEDGLAGSLAIDPPTVCVNYGVWEGAAGTQNSCKQKSLSAPGLPKLPVLAPFLPWNITTSQFVDRARQTFAEDCKSIGPSNWMIAAKWLAAYKLDIANRKTVIRGLAENLSKQEFLELGGGFASDGIKKTLRANLTRANVQSLTDENVVILNSLANVPRQAWLPEIPILPVVYYTDTGIDCINRLQMQVRILNLDLGGELPSYFSNAMDPDQTLQGAIQESPDPEDIVRSIYGYEKNPWYMAYIGVRAETRPIHSFAPFGKGVKLVARSIAQPFGGRIGPWMQAEWQPDQPKSSGEYVDKLSPYRFESGFTDPNDHRRLVPNFSRYPGDQSGLAAENSLSEIRPAILDEGLKIGFRDFHFIPGDLLSPTGDVMAWSNDPARPEPWVRDYETAAISPNLFDVMYYSIDPNFYLNYIQIANTGPLGASFSLRSDLGFRFGERVRFSVRDQILKTSQTQGPKDANYLIKESPGPLLTSWAQSGAVEYQFPDQQFALCSEPVGVNYEAKGISVPGSCVVGGRTGYSVKTVSKDYLRLSDLELGGRGIKGPLRNPPPEEF